MLFNVNVTFLLLDITVEAFRRLRYKAYILMLIYLYVIVL